MFSRTIKFAAVCAGILGAAALAALPDSARAADECLTAPKGATPAGAHWYYRLEKGTKRKCWYLADEASKATRAATAAPAPAASSTEAPNPPVAKSRTTRRSVADARAELTTPESDQPALATTTWPPLESSAETRLAPADAPPVAADAAPASNSWTMAARWPESNAGTAENGGPSDQRAAATPSATATPQETAADPLRIVLIALTAALLAAGIAGRLLLRRASRTNRPARSRAIWPDERPDHPMPVAFAPAPTTARRARPSHAPLDTQHASADVEEIEALLRASRSATG